MVYNIDNDNERAIFRRLTPDDKMEALYEMLSHSRKERDEKLQTIASSLQDVKAAQATAKKNQIKSDEKIDDLEKDLKRYRNTREKREKKLADLLDTTPPVSNMTPEQKQNTIDKITAIVTRKDDLVREIIKLAILVISIVGANKLIP